MGDIRCLHLLPDVNTFDSLEDAGPVFRLEYSTREACDSAAG